MHAVLNSALPIFALILTGFICGYFSVFDKTATDNLNRFAIYLALPSLMFVAMSRITPDQVRQLGFIGAFFGGSSPTRASRGSMLATATSGSWEFRCAFWCSARRVRQPRLLRRCSQPVFC